MTDGAAIKQRMDKYLSYKGYKYGWVEKQAQLGNGYLRNTAGGYTATKLAELVKVCKDLNINWLITGNGSMLLVDALPVTDGDTTTYNGDHIEQNQAPGGGLQVGKVNRLDYDPNRRSFFDSFNTIEVIEAIDLDSVPKKYLPLIRDIQSRKALIEELKNELDETKKKHQDERDKVEEKEAEIRNLNRQLNEAKDRLIAVLMPDSAKSGS